MVGLWRFLLPSAIIAVCLISGAWLIFRKQQPLRNQNDVFRRAYELEKWGRYDAAITLYETWLTDDKRERSNDDFLYQQIAMIYIMKAHKNPRTREESVRAADLSLQKALALYDSQPPKDIDVMLFEIGGTYEMLGDLTGKSKCGFYERAEQLFLRELPLIKGDTYTAYGHTTPLEPVRKDIRKHLDSAKQKYEKAGCPAHQDGSS